MKTNVAEILKIYPSGMPLNSPVFDCLTFDYVDEEQARIYCKTDKRDTVWFTAYGCINHSPNAKCVIFPKNEKSWEDIANTEVMDYFIVRDFFSKKRTDANIIQEEFNKLSENLLSSILSLNLSFNDIKNTVNEINNKLISKEELDIEEIKEQITSTINQIRNISSNNGVIESTLLEIIRTVSK